MGETDKINILCYMSITFITKNGQIFPVVFIPNQTTILNFTC